MTRPRRLWNRRVAWTALAFATMGAGGVITANWWIQRSTDRHRYGGVADVPFRDVAIVPGARVHRDGTPSVPLHDRLACALELYRAGRVARILVSGDHAAPEYDETNAMRRWLVERGVPSEHVFMDHAGFRTLDTMQRARRVFAVTNATICTQDFHLARSIFLARDAGIDAVGVPADRHPDPYAARNSARELVARAVAWLDIKVLGTQPSLLGRVHDVATGDAASTHDRWTR